MAENSPAAIRLPVAFVEELSRAASIEQVLSTAVAWLAGLSDVDRAKITFLDEAQIVSRAFTRDGIRSLTEDMEPVRPGSPRDRVLASGEALQLDADDLIRDADPVMQLLYDNGARAALFVPMQGGGRTVGVIGLIRNTGTPFPASQIRQLTAAGEWIAGQARLMQQLRTNARLAETDPLTGLANRARLMRVLGGPGALHLPDSKGRVMGVLHLDLDHFKETNDRLGHAAGDAVLLHAAQVMKRTVAATDLVARIGGDEFVIVTRTDPHGRRLHQLAERIAADLAEPVEIAGTRLACPASIGTAMAGPDDRSAERLIANADIALYQVKRHGRGGVRAFTQAMRTRFDARRELLAQLHAAVDQHRFEPLFQPVLALDTGALAGLELLARWPDPTRGNLAPGAFLGAAKEAGLTLRIDAMVRSKGLDALRDLRGAGWDVPALSFNASAETLADPDLAESLLWEVLGKGLAPADLSVEVEESHLNADADGLVETNISLLAELGFPVEIDGFGTGHASMPQMRRLRISGLKLAPALTAQLSDPCCEAILRAILAMAAELGLSVTAKGVESAADLPALAALNCHRAQGFGIAEPLDRAALADYLQRRRRAPRLTAI